MKPSLEDVLFFHTVAVGHYGGSEGVRNLQSLEAALHRPWGSSFGQDHFPTTPEKAAALCESLIRRHPFVDANKRTAMMAAVFLLEESESLEFTATQEESERFAVAVAAGELDTPEMASWFKEHSQSPES